MSTVIKSQKAAITVLKKICDNFLNSQGKIRPHCIISGQSGTGKSYLLERLAASLGIHVLNVNAAQITREGISGNSLSKALEPLKKLQGKPVIVFLDEFDKLFLGVDGKTGDERSGVQSEILHIISSGVCQVIADYGHYHELNTRNCLFMFAGAFQGIQDLNPDRLMQLGMYPELIGRVNLHVALPSIDCDDLIKAMRKDPLLQHYYNTHNISEAVKQKEIEDTIAAEITKNFSTNVIGYRLITRLIHQYFIYDGVFPEYKDAETLEIEKTISECEISFGD